MSFRVGIIGLPVVDQVAHIPKFPQRGGHVSGSGLTLTPGGPAVNYATAIARLGGRASLIGPVGNDAFGQLIISELGKEGVDVSYLKDKPESTTVTVLVLFDEGGQGEMRSFSLGLNEMVEKQIFKGADVREKLAAFDAVFLDGILIFSPQWVGDALAAVKYVKEQAKPPLIVCDPNLRIPGSTLPEDLAARIKDLLAVSDVVLVNEHESLLLSGTQDPKEAAASFFNSYPNLEIAVAKRGAEGALIQKRGQEPLFIPPFAVQVEDTSGAGDSFGASFIASLLEGRTLKEAGYLAAAAGALATTAKGAWPGLPSRAARDGLVEKAGVLK